MVNETRALSKVPGGFLDGAIGGKPGKVIASKVSGRLYL